MLEIMIPRVSDLLQSALHLIEGAAHVSSLGMARVFALGLAVPIPTPSSSEPPGADKAQVLLNWGIWIVFFCCVAGVLLVAARMAIKHHKGEGGSHAASLVWVLGACILAASASLLVGGIVNGGGN